MPAGENAIFTDEEMKTREKENILNALRQCNGKVPNKDGATKLLKMKPTTLYSRIKKLNLTI